MLEKYKAQLIWGIVLRNKYKKQFSKIEKNIEQTIETKEYKNKEDLYDLNKWNNFETKNPRIFAGMYQFWCMKSKK